VRSAHFGLLPTLLSPFGNLIFPYLLLRSRIAYKRGQVMWKGRTYSRAEAGPMLEEEKTTKGA
jgi:hypothetical protein